MRVSVQYLEAWLRGTGCVAIYGLAEDAATVESTRSLAWQWIHHGATLDDGTALTVERFRTLLADEMERIQLEVGDAAFQGGRFEEARAVRADQHAGGVRRVHHAPRVRAARGRGRGAGEDPRVRGERRGRVPRPSAPRSPSLGGHRPPLHPGGRREAAWLGSDEHTLAHMGATRPWELLHSEPYVHALGALTGSQAVQMVKAGLKAIYLSRQVAADANTAAQTYPDQSLYPANLSRRSSAD